MDAQITADGTLWIPVEEGTEPDMVKCVVLCTNTWAKSYLPKEKIIVPDGITKKGVLHA